MQSVQQAIASLIERASLLPAVHSIEVTHSLGRILAVDVVACIDVPPADNSAMDGYAFCYEDAINQSYSLPISQRVPAGTAPLPCSRIRPLAYLPAVRCQKALTP